MIRSHAYGQPSLHSASGKHFFISDLFRCNNENLRVLNLSSKILEQSKLSRILAVLFVLPIAIRFLILNLFIAMLFLVLWMPNETIFAWNINICNVNE
jgi:hypothetical protein